MNLKQFFDRFFPKPGTSHCNLSREQIKLLFPDAVIVDTAYMFRRDLPAVLSIEQQVFNVPWPEDVFIRCMRCRNSIGMKAMIDGQVIGYMVYQIYRNRVQLVNLAVDPEHQRNGVGRLLIDELKRRSKYRVELEVRETNLPAQQFFKASGFRAVSVLKGYYDDSHEDAYVMTFRRRQGAVV